MFDASTWFVIWFQMSCLKCLISDIKATAMTSFFRNLCQKIFCIIRLELKRHDDEDQKLPQSPRHHHTTQLDINGKLKVL